MANKKDIVKKKKNEVIREAKVEGINIKNPRFGASFCILIGSIVLLILVLTGLYWYYENNESNPKLSDASQFKKEYEKYNSDGDYLKLTLPAKNIIKYSSYKEVNSLLDGKTGVIYFGFPTCPWCRSLIPVLLDAAEETGIDTIYYLNNKEDRDIKKLDNKGNVVTEKEATKDYQKLVKRLSSVLGEYEGLNDSNIKRLYFPTVIFIKDGKIIGSQIGTVDSQNDPRVPLTDQQYQELKESLTNNMSKILTCSGTC